MRSEKGAELPALSSTQAAFYFLVVELGKAGCRRRIQYT